MGAPLFVIEVTLENYNDSVKQKKHVEKNSAANGSLPIQGKKW